MNIIISLFFKKIFTTIKKLITNEKVMIVVLIVWIAAVLYQKIKLIKLNDKIDNLELLIAKKQSEVDSMKISNLASQLSLREQLETMTQKISIDNDLSTQARKKLDSLVLAQSLSDTVSYAERLRTVENFIRQQRK